MGAATTYTYDDWMEYAFTKCNPHLVDVYRQQYADKVASGWVPPALTDEQIKRLRNRDRYQRRRSNPEYRAYQKEYNSAYRSRDGYREAKKARDAAMHETQEYKLRRSNWYFNNRDKELIRQSHYRIEKKLRKMEEREPGIRERMNADYELRMAEGFEWLKGLMAEDVA